MKNLKYETINEIMISQSNLIGNDYFNFWCKQRNLDFISGLFIIINKKLLNKLNDFSLSERRKREICNILTDLRINVFENLSIPQRKIIVRYLSKN